MELRLCKEMMARKGIIEGTVEVLEVTDVNWFVPTPSGKAVVITYRFGRSEKYPDGIPQLGDLLPLEFFEGQDRDGWRDRYFAMHGWDRSGAQ